MAPTAPTGSVGKTLAARPSTGATTPEDRRERATLVTEVGSALSRRLGGRFGGSRRGARSGRRRRGSRLADGSCGDGRRRRVRLRRCRRGRFGRFRVARFGFGGRRWRRI